MKYSGVEWIGNVPDSWEIRKVKQCFYISKEPANQKNPTVLSLARSGVKVRDISNNEGQLAASYDNYNVVKPGDLLLNPMDLYSGANCNMSEIEGVISPAYVNLRKKIELNAKFFDYFFKTQYWTMAMFAHGKGVSFDNRWTLNSDSLLNYRLPFPSQKKQNEIALLLDKKISEMDELIVLENNQIELLKEYKFLKIKETVCKGIHKNTFVESGVDWIGQMPSDWALTKIKYVTDISRGLFNHRPRNDAKCFDGPYPFLQTGDVARSNKYIGSYSQTLSEFGKNISKEFPKGTLTMTIAANVGDVSILSFDAFFPDSVVGFTPVNGNDSEYLYYLFSAMKNEFIRSSILSTQLNLNIERIKDMYIPFAKDLDEQKMIAGYLNEKCNQIDSLIATKRKKISEIERYKKSLIFEYTTGKKEITA